MVESDSENVRIGNISGVQKTDFFFEYNISQNMFFVRKDITLDGSHYSEEFGYEDSTSVQFYEIEYFLESGNVDAMSSHRLTIGPSTDINTTIVSYNVYEGGFECSFAGAVDYCGAVKTVIQDEWDVVKFILNAREIELNFSFVLKS